MSGPSKTTSATDGATASKSPAAAPVIVWNGSQGLKICQGCLPFRVLQDLSPKTVRSFEMSPDGKTLVWSDAGKLIAYNLESMEVLWEIPVRETAHMLKMSPKSSYVAAWYPFKSAPPGSDEDDSNLLFCDLKTGQVTGKMTCKKMTRWEPDWTEDESICCRLNNSELQFYENNSFSRWSHSMQSQKVANFSITSHERNSGKYIATYSTGTKGQASFVRIYRYPNLGNVISSKSFFKADSVNLMWSPRGDSLLFLCICDVDKSGKSYYGEQKLNYMEASPSSSCNYTVTLKKDGPIHAVSWVPITSKDQAQAYVVIYGFVPPIVSIFDTKGNIIFDFHGKEMKVNQITFNSFGSLLALAGFGNLRGGVFVWDMKSKKQVAEFLCPETTDISWSPDGMTLLTATTAPRLRVGNGFKVWKYSGSSIYEEPFAVNTELYKISWQPRPGLFSPPKIVNTFKPSQVAAAAPTKYVPPSQRAKQEYINQLKEAEKKEKVDKKEAKPKLTPTEKKMSALNRQLDEISQLKRKQSEGIDLKKEQLQKIDQEDQIRNELTKLKLSSS